jgi:hypothetical protein
MKRILLYGALLLIPYLATCQEDYFVYHAYVNKAEDKIVDEDFSSALIYYDSAFSQFKYVFVKDLVIAAQLAAYLEDRSRCMDYMVRAMYGGYKVYCFEQLYQIKQVLNDLDWKEIKRKETLCREQYKASINWPLNIEISKRHRKMDDARNTHWGDQLLCENYDYLFSLKDTYPFLSARRIGIDDHNLDPLLLTTKGWTMLQDCDASNTKVFSTLVSIEDPIRDYGMQYFIDAIRSGDLLPCELAWIYYNNPKNVDCHPENIETEDIPDLMFHCAANDPKYDIDRINVDRKSIGLGRYETWLKMLEIEIKYNMKLQFENW